MSSIETRKNDSGEWIGMLDASLGRTWFKSSEIVAVLTLQNKTSIGLKSFPGTFFHTVSTVEDVLKAIGLNPPLAELGSGGDNGSLSIAGGVSES